MQKSVREAHVTVGHEWRALAVLALAVLLSMSTWFSATAVVAQLREAWELTTRDATFLTIAVQLGFVVGAVGASLLNLPDRLRPRRLMLLSALAAALVNLLLVVADGAGVALALRFATGVFLAGVYPPSLKAMATWFRRGRGLALGVMVGALTVGSAVPHLVNALGGVQWRIVIVVTSILTVVGGLLAEFATRDGPYPFPRAPFQPREASRVLANRGVRLATFGYFGHMWELYAMWGWFAVFYTDVLVQHGVVDAPRVSAFATFAVIAVGAAGCVAGGVLGDRWGRARTTAAAMALSGTAAVVIGPLRGAGPRVVLVVALVWGVSVVADSAQFSALVTELADQRYVGTALTLQLAVGFLLTVPTIWLVPVLRDAVSWQWAFAFLAFGPAFGLGAMLRLDSILRRSVAA